MSTSIPQIGAWHKQITAVGSRVTCTPAPVSTDQDWLVLLDEKDYNAFSVALIDGGWIVGGSLIPNDANYLPESQRFNSFTKGEDNVIATASPEFHRRFLSASAMAKKMNLLEKTDRIALFQAVLYGAICSPEFQPVIEFIKTEPIDSTFEFTEDFA